MKSMKRAIAAVAMAAAMASGGVMAMAPAAQAAATVDSSACSAWHQQNEYVTETVNFRTGPSTEYSAFGQLAKGTKVYVACTSDGFAYVKALSGPWTGTKGWVSWYYLTGF